MGGGGPATWVPSPGEAGRAVSGSHLSLCAGRRRLTEHGAMNARSARWFGGVGWAVLSGWLIGLGEAAATGLFADPRLEAAVRQQVFTKRYTDEPLVEADVIGVSTIEARGRGIESLAGLERCRNLAMLDLAGNRVLDLGPLSGLTRLQFLDVQSNRVETLAPLGKVTGLQYLHAARNGLTDVAPLSGLTNLSALYLSGNRIEDIGPLVHLRRLASLYLDGNRIESLAGIEWLRGLTVLSLSDNRVADPEPLTGLERVQLLFLDRNRIQDLEPLVRWVKGDEEQRFAPFLRLHLAGNPLGTVARQRQIPEIETAGVKVFR